MKEYQSFGALARAFERALVELPAAHEIALEAGALIVEATAKAEFGHYQREDMGPMTSWEELKDATKQEHIQKIVDGEAAPDAGPNTPLLVKGDLRESVKHETAPKEFVVGSESPIMVYQELGTPEGIPPRPVLGTALYRDAQLVVDLIAQATVDTLTGKK